MIRKHGPWVSCLVLGVIGMYQFISVAPAQQVEEYRTSHQSQRAHAERTIYSADEKPGFSLLLPEVKEMPSLEGFMDEGMRHQFKKVAEQYAQDIQFPPYSKPLKITDWAQLNPLPFVPQKINLSMTGDVSAEIVLPHYQVTRDDGLDVEVRVYGEGFGGASVKASLAHSQTPNDERSHVSLTSTGSIEGGVVFQGRFVPSQLDFMEDGEVLLRASIQSNQGDKNEVVASFALSDSVAELMEVGASYIEGADLVIPLSFDVEEAGLYRVRANLFDQSSGDPISHLNASFKLSAIRDEGTFKVHAATLRHAGSKGPYLLSDISVIKAPESAGASSGYGRASQEDYVVTGFDLDSYSREEYQNNFNEKRLAFLQKMSSQPL